MTFKDYFLSENKKNHGRDPKTGRMVKVDLPVDDIINMWNSGMDAVQIAARPEIPVSDKTILNRIRDFIRDNPDADVREIPDMKFGQTIDFGKPIEDIINMWNSGMNSYQILDQLGFKNLSVSERQNLRMTMRERMHTYAAQNPGVNIRSSEFAGAPPHPGTGPQNRGWKNVDINRIMDMYLNQNLPMRAIGEELGVSKQVIARRIRSQGEADAGDSEYYIRPPWGTTASGSNLSRASKRWANRQISGTGPGTAGTQRFDRAPTAGSKNIPRT